MRGIDGPRGEPKSFPKLFSVIKTDPNNFLSVLFSQIGLLVNF